MFHIFQNQYPHSLFSQKKRHNLLLINNKRIVNNYILISLDSLKR